VYITTIRRKFSKFICLNGGLAYVDILRKNTAQRWFDFIS
jgi:hypothetical protein